MYLKNTERLGKLVPAIPGQKRLIIPAAIRSQSLEASDAHRFPTDQKIILQMGTAPNKNLTRVWSACEDLRCHLAIVGPPTDELNRLQASSPLSHSLHTNVSDEELERLYLGCDAVAFVSTHEGFGMPVIEAQVFGKPCVTSAIEPMKSHAGGGAILVDPENGSDIQEALRTALTDAELCERTMSASTFTVSRATKLLDCTSSCTVNCWKDEALDSNQMTRCTPSTVVGTSSAPCVIISSRRITLRSFHS